MTGRLGYDGVDSGVSDTIGHRMTHSTILGGCRSLDELPEFCIANILSFTTAPDVCRLSSVSRNFRSAGTSPVAWERFLPSDYEDIMLRSAQPTLVGSSKKHLFLTLCRHPLLIDQGRMTFQLEKWSGKKCFMVSARQLDIAWSDTPEYWEWTIDPNSRFSEMAMLIHVCWLEISYGASELLPMLSSATRYAVCLVYKFADEHYGFDQFPAEVSVRVVGGDEDNSRLVWLDHVPSLATVPNPTHAGLPTPTDRGDGWLEVELGDLFNLHRRDHDEHCEIQAHLLLTRGGYLNWKSGLIVQGIEFRPKPANE